MRTSQKVIDKMEVEKGKVQGATKNFDKKSLVFFFRDVKLELNKVEWTTKEELKSYVKIVLLSIFCFSMLVYGIDLLIQGALGVVSFLFG